MCFLLPLVSAAKSTTQTSTQTVFLPPRSTGSASHIYASVITSDSSKTEYLLACQTAFSSPYTCGNDFTGVTVTYGGTTAVDVAFGADTYDCDLKASSAVCATKTASGASEGTTTLGSSASKEWMTAITVLEVKKKTTTTKNTASKTADSAAAGGVCKRSTKHGSSGSDSDSGSSSSGSSSSSSNSGDDDSSSNSNSNSNSKKKNSNGDDCSKAATLAWDLGLVVVGVGIAFAFGL